MSLIRHIQIKVNEEDAQWFDDNFSIASKQEFFEQCLKYLRIAVEQGLVPTPNVYPARAAVDAAQHFTQGI